MHQNMQTVIVRDPRDAEAKVHLFLERFSGRQDIYGTYDPKTGCSWQSKEPVTNQVIRNHLCGKRPYGVYLLVGNRTRAAVADFDHENPHFPIQFVFRGRHYDLETYIERSKSKGYHVWVFFAAPGIQAWKIRRVFQHILNEIELPAVEVFPKQDCISKENALYGNFINTPLFGAVIHAHKTVFLDPADDLKPYPNQWDFLDNVQCTPESLLDNIIEINDLGRNESTLAAQKGGGRLGIFQAAYALPPCAQKMLTSGVTENQRVACFRLAVHLRRIGLPYELAVATLREWAKKNHPTNGKLILSDVEIKAQTAGAYIKEYHGYGCEDPSVTTYCSQECPLRSKTAVETLHKKMPQQG
jgi:hypothetical protein